MQIAGIWARIGPERTGFGPGPDRNGFSGTDFARTGPDRIYPARILFGPGSDRTGPEHPWLGLMGPWAHGPMAHDPWVLGPWALGPWPIYLGPWALGPWALYMGVSGPIMALLFPVWLVT